MKMRHIIPALAILLTFFQVALGQGFVNLDFEDATIVSVPGSPYYPYAVYANYAIPGWTVGAGNFQGTNIIIYNDQSLGATSVQLFGTDSEYSPAPLDGDFSIDLYGGVTSAAGASISQTGLVPADSAAIIFLAGGNLAGGSLLVSLGGQSISYSAISRGLNYTMYGGNIPAVFTGKVELLTFTAPEFAGPLEIDDIQFSSSSVPEPSFLGLSGVCILLFWFRVSWPNTKSEGMATKRQPIPR